MNQARINEKTIDDGDYLIIDGADKIPKKILLPFLFPPGDDFFVNGKVIDVIKKPAIKD